MADWIKLTGELAWPLAAVGIFVIFIFSLDRIARAFRGFPIIRKIKLRNFEVELARENLDTLKADTEKTFKELIEKTDVELFRFERTVNLKSYASKFCSEFWKELSAESQGKALAARPRMTVYVPDPIFQDQLYQLSPYCNPANGTFKHPPRKGPGRRFSMRYGIIGRAARSEVSQIIGDAFQGNDRKKAALINEWSMMESQAEAAAAKPSCLALIIPDPETGKMIGIVYIDAEEKDFFCEKSDQASFLAKIEGLEVTEKLGKCLSDFWILARQIELNFDLVHVGNRFD
ncbi:hypothetical protein P8R33_07405 [Qipengyuania sp. XHP0211]|uniref:hypothetical protein n=1 Tax=Qipengyuania sp. XHP0211 TaxID=3038079 RepID=UPI00241F8180|nr:hypothetical protein [Qipengyuania sp. XHP0211]MDG5750926.1 hypothetical protein [Qipengyuania sp. XHP0211]